MALLTGAVASAAVTFSRTDHPTSPNPASVAVGDFNQDGDPDLAVANQESGDVSVLLGQAGGGFAAKVDHPTDIFPAAVAVGDFNQDGDPDLAIANSGSSSVSVLLGGTGAAFTEKVDHSAGTNPRSVAVGDFNQDGDSDLAVANFESNTVSVLLGQAGAGFAGKVDHPTGENPNSVAVGDFDQDAALDLAVANVVSGNLSALLNTSPPAVSADPLALAFGTQLVGSLGSVQTVTITNTGDGSLRVTGVLAAGANPDDFVKSSDTCTGERVAPGRTCAVGVAFGPTAGGERTAALRISSNAPGGSHDLVLSGTGLDTNPSDFLGPVRLRPDTFAAANRGASALPAARRARVGTRVSFSLDEAARVTFTAQRALPGRRLGRRCVRANRNNRRRRRCTRYVRQRGSFTRNAIAGANGFRFTGRLRNRKLRPGRHRLVAVTTDAAGNRSRPKRTRFTIVRR